MGCSASCRSSVDPPMCFAQDVSSVFRHSKILEASKVATVTTTCNSCDSTKQNELAVRKRIVFLDDEMKSLGLMDMDNMSWTSIL